MENIQAVNYFFGDLIHSIILASTFANMIIDS